MSSSSSSKGPRISAAPASNRDDPTGPQLSRAADPAPTRSRVQAAAVVRARARARPNREALRSARARTAVRRRPGPRPDLPTDHDLASMARRDSAVHRRSAHVPMTAVKLAPLARDPRTGRRAAQARDRHRSTTRPMDRSMAAAALRRQRHRRARRGLANPPMPVMPNQCAGSRRRNQGQECRDPRRAIPLRDPKTTAGPRVRSFAGLGGCTAHPGIIAKADDHDPDQHERGTDGETHVHQLAQQQHADGDANDREDVRDH